MLRVDRHQRPVYLQVNRHQQQLLGEQVDLRRAGVGVTGQGCGEREKASTAEMGAELEVNGLYSPGPTVKFVPWAELQVGETVLFSRSALNKSNVHSVLELKTTAISCGKLFEFIKGL